MMREGGQHRRPRPPGAGRWATALPHRIGRLARWLVVALALPVLLVGGVMPGAMPALAQSGLAWDLIGGQHAPTGVSVLTVAPNGTFYVGNSDGAVWSWNASQWSVVGLVPVSSSPGSSMDALAWYDGTLYAGVSNGNATGPGLYELQGSTFVAVSGLPSQRPSDCTHSGWSNMVTALASYGGTLFLATGNGVWTWNGSAFEQLSFLSASLFYQETGYQYPPGCEPDLPILSVANGQLMSSDGVYIYTVTSGGVTQTYGPLVESNTLLSAANPVAIVAVDGTICVATDGHGLWCLTTTDQWYEVPHSIGSIEAATVWNGVLYLGTIYGTQAYTAGLSAPWTTVTTSTEPTALEVVNGKLWGATGNGLGVLGPPLPSPTVTGVTPSQGSTGGSTVVTIAGTGLSDAYQVMFGGVPAQSFTVDSDSEITAVAPPGTGTVDVTVYTLAAPSFTPTTPADQFAYVASTCGSASLSGSAVTVASCDGNVTLAIPQGALASGNATLTPQSLSTLAQSLNSPVAPPGDQSLLAELKQAAQAGTLSVSVGGETIPVPQSLSESSFLRFYQQLNQATWSATGVSPSTAQVISQVQTQLMQAMWDIASGQGSAQDLTNFEATANWLTQYVADPPSQVDPQGTLAYIENADRNAFLFGTPPATASSSDPWAQLYTNALTDAALNGCDANCQESVFGGPGIDGSIQNYVNVGCQGAQCAQQAEQSDLLRVQWMLDSPGAGCIVSPTTCQGGGGGDPPPGVPPAPTMTSTLGDLAVPLLTADNLMPALSEGVSVGLGGQSLSQPAALSLTYSPSSIPQGDTAAVYSFGSNGGATALPTTLSGDTATAEITQGGTYGVLPAPSEAPSVSGISPASGPAAGATAVTITGANLAGASAVYFGPTQATSVQAVSPTEVTAVAPPGTGTVAVTVTTAAGTSAPDALSAFAYQGSASAGATPTVTGSVSAAITSPPAQSSPAVVGGSGTQTPDTSVAVVGLSGTVRVEDYGTDPNPAATAPFRGAGAYFDVSLSSPALTAAASLTVSQCAGATPGESLYWFDSAVGTAGAWQPVSPAATYGGGCLQAVLTATSSPSLSQLGGTPFAVAIPLAVAPPTLTSEPVTVGGVSTTVVGDLGYNPEQAVADGLYVGYVEERAAIEAGASFSGEGTDSSYLADILSGGGVGLQMHVSAVEQGQFAALYQKLGIIPTWTGYVVTPSQAVAALAKTDAPVLAIENYLVQVDGFTWAEAENQASPQAATQAGA